MVVVEQTLAVTLPANTVRMMHVQPFLDFEEPALEPFRPSTTCAQRLMDAIDSVFARITEHSPQVVLFPEFAIPGVQAVERVAAALSCTSVASPTIVIGGVSGLHKEAFAELCALPNIAVIDLANAPSRVQDTQWVNTSVTFVKDDEGTVKMWLQPKLSSSWPEANCHHQMMFSGSLVRIFRARFSNDVPCRFLSLLCFDWVGREHGVGLPEAILREFNEACHATGSPQDLQWAFVLQHNPAPNHATFLTATSRFLSEVANAPFVRRRDAAVVMVSTASSQRPSRGRPAQYGYSSLVFSPAAPFDSRGCWPTFATQSSGLRASDALLTCKDTVFREMGECVHIADVRVPNFVVPDPTDRTAALVRARAHPLVGTVVDPRIPNDVVPAVVKWANDELDDVPDLCTTYFTEHPLEPALRSTHGEMVDGYRRLRPQDLALRIEAACATRLLTNGRTDPASDVDTTWDGDERRGLRHVIQSLTLLGSAVDLDPVACQLHGRCGEGIEIAAITGTTHADCVRALTRLAVRTHAPILFISQDDQNTPLLPREAERFADPRGYCGFKPTDAQTLLAKAREQAWTEYRKFVTELVNVDDRRII